MSGETQVSDLLNPLLIGTFGLVAVTTGATGLVVFLANRKRNWNRWLASFLVLISGNFLVQAIATSIGSGHDSLGLNQIASSEDWSSIGFLFLALDSPVLLYFSGLFPRRAQWIDRPLMLFLTCAPAVVFLILEGFTRALSSPSDVLDLPRLVFFLYLGSCYGAAAFRLLRACLEEPSMIMSDQVRVVAAGVAIVALPRVALVANDLGLAFWGMNDASAFVLRELPLRLVILWTLFAYLAREARRRATPARRDAALWITLTTGVALLALSLVWTFSSLILAWSNPSGSLWTTGAYAHHGLAYALRWLLFSAAMCYGIVRHEILAVDRFILGAASFAVFVIAEIPLVAIAVEFRGALFAAIVAAGCTVIAGVVGFGIKWRLDHLDSSAYLRTRALDAYRSLVASAIASRDLERRADEMERARKNLQISDREHSRLVAIAKWEEGSAIGQRLVLGRYDQMERLGSGGFATVHLARDRTTGDLVVLKRMRPEWTSDRAALDSALREMEVARRVSDPFLVAMHELARDGDELVLVLEYVPGGNLRVMLDRRGPLEPEEGTRIVRDVLSGLAALHDAGIVHGDVKPENVLLTAGGRAKLADFGAAHSRGGRRTLVRATPGRYSPGTIAYMPPERLAGRSGRSVHADVYGAGALAFELLAGWAFEPQFLATLRDPNRFREHPTDEAWRVYFCTALNPEPEQRFRDARSMLRAMPAHPPTMVGGTQRPRVHKSPR